ncbi:hypothetical protein PF011_g29235 [Phytophthora fragariae]|uniref:Secreted protein n=1 Tax=Phytophthora fragariae TaxID=53985 RepID=A0A6A3H0M7_9STRA|nr:hypothetical protein PF003_g18303 [Phytophthora fragariae]KAE8962850.1 hypothetical protein PF011_g29235 [Phytophthora fragariae]
MAWPLPCLQSTLLRRLVGCRSCCGLVPSGHQQFSSGSSDSHPRLEPPHVLNAGGALVYGVFGHELHEVAPQRQSRLVAVQVQVAPLLAAQRQLVHP